MANDTADVALGTPLPESGRLRRTWGALGHAERHLRRSALKLAAYLVVGYLVLKLIPALEQALSSLEHARWQMVLVALAVETLSEMGFVVSWRAIVDPENLCRCTGGCDDDLCRGHPCRRHILQLRVHGPSKKLIALLAAAVGSDTDLDPRRG